jgi:hypothetical protein
MRSRVAVLLAAALLQLVVAARARAADDEDNPHEEMTRSKSACIDCHTRLPKPGEHAPDYFLVDAPSETCLGCHGEYEHAGVSEHAGKDAAPLPGDEHGKIACFTCHDPHPGGTLEGRTVHKSMVSEPTRAFIAGRTLPASVERREPSEAFGALLRSPFGDQGCPVCHDPSSWKERASWSERVRVLPRY